MATPLLSICVMTFRRPQTLARTLESLLQQVADAPEVELVVCDNASEDGTAAMVESYRLKYPLLRYHCNPENLGFDGNVVTCVQQGRGAYVAFFSDDDAAPPGHVAFLVETLQESRPAVLYLNHRPFLHEDVNQLGPPASPQVDLASNGGETFLLTAGLGFISSLVVAREAALIFIEKVVLGVGGAHLDIASRIVLTRMGPCLYRGTHSVYARHAYEAGSILIGGCVTIAKLYRTLVAEGLLSPEANRTWLRSQVRHILPRQVVSARARRQSEYPLRGMLELYGGQVSFYYLVLPLYIIPRSVLGSAYWLGRCVLHTWRRLGLRGRAT